MDKKTTGVIATIAAVVLCGCPGLLMCFMGAIFAVVSQIPGADIDIMGSNDPANALTTGLILLAVSVVLILIPILVGIFTLRKKKVKVSDQTPIPPTS